MVEKILVKDGELSLSIQSSSSNYSSSNSVNWEEMSIDDDISEFSEDHKEINFIETKKPQTKSFSRNNLEIDKIIE